MKLKNKLSRGMTLVEVLVAMTIFAVMASAIFTVILHANKTANRAKMRDVELSTQTNIVGKKNKALDELTELNPAGISGGNYKILFQSPQAGKGEGNVDNVKVYETNEGMFETDFDFKLKTVISASSLTGLTLQTDQLRDNEYLLKFTNNRPESVIVRFSLTDGHIFEGSGQQYVHTRNNYSKVIPSGASADIGFYNSNSSSVGAIAVEVTGVLTGAYLPQFTLNAGTISSTKRTANLDIKQIGADPTVVVDINYPHD